MFPVAFDFFESESKES
jgi:transposase-like protein